MDNDLIDELYKTLDAKDKIINQQALKIAKINSLYCSVIAKCREMIRLRYYLNENGIRAYAEEIMSMCKYYIPEAKEILKDLEARNE